jgi:hypothetical protein
LGQVTSSDRGVEALRYPSHLYSRAEILARPSPVPDIPGIYGWYFRTPPGGIDANRGIKVQDRSLLYVGIAPRGPGQSKATLRSRLRNHYRGNAKGSTLRFTIGCLLGLELRRIGGGTVMTFGPADSDLSSWMADNAFVTWIKDFRPWLLESVLIHSLDRPLNLDQNASHAFHAHLSELRRRARERALALPILA